MSVPMEIRESETGVVRVFHLDLPPEAIERFTVQAGTGEWPLVYGLGAKRLSESFVDVVAIRDLGAMSLSTYLAEAHGVPPETLSADAARLDRLRGHVIVLPSQAFARTAQTLNVRTPLRWVGTYEEVKGRTMAAPIRSKSARGSLGGGTSMGEMPSGALKWALAALVALFVAGVLLVFL